MKKVMLLSLLVLFAGMNFNAQERRKRPEEVREQQEEMKRKFNLMRMKKGFHDIEMKKEFLEMGKQKRELEFENYKSELEFEMEMREIELEKARMAIEGGKGSNTCRWGRCSKGKKMICGTIFFLMFMLMGAVIHILLTIWVYSDTRKRASSGIWIVITLLTGFMGAFLYSLVRIGDNKKK